MDRDGIITSVKVKIDELTPDGVALPLEEIIGPVLDESARELLLALPSRLLDAEDLNLEGIAYSEDKRAYIPVPNDFLKIGKIRFPKWEKTVSTAIKEESPEYTLENNPYTRGGWSRPTVSLINKDGDTVLEGSKVDGSVAEEKITTEATKRKELLPEELPDMLIDSLGWLAASKVLQITGNINGGSAAHSRYEANVRLL